MPRPALYAAFFLSGACGLIYEVVWERWLELHLGVTAYAAAAVAAAFMLGLALGAAAGGKLAERARSPLRFYGLCELGIGLYALALPRLLPLILHSSAAGAGSAFLRAAAAMLVPTMLMGATLPLLCRQAADRGDLGREFGRLYGVNALGGIAGALGAGFWLLQTWGARATNGAAAAASLALGVIFLLAAPSGERKAVETTPASEDAPNWLLAAVFTSGFCSLACQILWFRSLRMVIGSTVYAFSILLGVFLLAIALAGWAAARASSWNREALIRRLALAQAAAGVLLLLGFPALPASWPILTFFGKLYFSWLGSWGWSRLVHLMIAGTVMLAPAFLMALLLPSSPALSPGARTAAAGRLYAANTLGAVLGSLSAVFLLIPVFGLIRAAALIAAAQAALGAGLWFRGGGAVGPGALAAAVLAALGPIWAWRACAPSPGVLYEVDGLAATIRVYAQGSRKILETDNLQVQGADPASPGSHPKRLGYLPVLLHPAPSARRALQIGLGTGINLAGLAEGVQAAEVVELLPELPRAAGFFHAENDAVLENPKVALRIDDGRAYLQNQPGPYDLIVGDLFFPENAGTGSLYSLEHFSRQREVLAPGGLAVQWLPLHQLSPESLRTIVGTFAEAFPHVSLWWGTLSGSLPVAGLVGSAEPLSVSPALFRNKNRNLAPGLAAVGWNSPACVLSAFIARDADLRAFSAGVPLNTDDLPRTEFDSPKVEIMGRAHVARNLLDLSLLGKDSPAPLSPADRELSAKTLALSRARRLRLRALSMRASGDSRGAEALLKGLRPAPGCADLNL